MKRFKTFEVVLGAVALTMALGPAAALAEPTSARDVADSTVTISGLQAGDTVSAYLIGDADINASNEVTYTMVSGLPEAYDTEAELSGLASDGYSFKGLSTDAQKAAGAIAASTAVTGATAAATATATGETATLTLGSGYYLVRVTNAAGTNDRVYQNMLVDLSPVAGGTGYAPAPDPQITAKQTPVTVDKKSKEPDETTFTKTTVTKYNVGDTIPYEVTSAIPSYSSDSLYATFYLTDDPDEGIDIQADSVQVAVEGVQTVTKDTDYTVTKEGGDGGKLTVTFSQAFILTHPGAAVTLNYNAKLTDKAKVTKTGEVFDYTNNTVTVTYTTDTNTNPSQGGTNTTEEHHVDTHTYGINFKKKDADGNALAGATFTLYDESGANKIQINGADVTATSDANGYVSFSGLAEGTYTLKETTVPAGKQAVKDFKVILNDTTATADNPATTDVAEAIFDVLEDVTDANRGFLPQTGDAGTMALTAAGVVLLVAGVATLTYRRKKARRD